MDKSINHYLKEISEKGQIIENALNESGLLGNDSPIEFSNSKGGFYLWGKFKDGTNTDILAQQALQYGVSFVPGSIYGIESEYNDSFRIAYAQINKERIAEAVLRFHKLIQNKIYK